MRYKYCPFYNSMVLRAHAFDKDTNLFLECKINLINYLFLYFWLFVAACGLSLVVVTRSYSLVVVYGLLNGDFSVLEHRLWTLRLQYLWNMGLVVPSHVGSSRPGTEPMSLALAGRFSAPGPSEKSLTNYFPLVWNIVLKPTIYCCTVSPHWENMLPSLRDKFMWTLWTRNWNLTWIVSLI